MIRKRDISSAGFLAILILVFTALSFNSKPIPLSVNSIAPNPSDSVIQYAQTFPSSVAPSSSASGGETGGGGGGSGSVVQVTTTTYSARVEAKSEGIIGEINHGQFEDVATQIRFDTEQIQGFVKSSDLIYGNGSWHGDWTLNVPTPDAQTFTFHLRQLIDANGKVLSIEQKTQDVTEQTKGNASAVPFAPIVVKLTETSTVISHSPLAQFFPAFATIGDIANGVIYWAIIGLPTYGLILLLVIVSRRIFIPILVKAAQASKVETKEQKSE